MSMRHIRPLSVDAAVLHSIHLIQVTASLMNLQYFTSILYLNWLPHIRFLSNVHFLWMRLKARYARACVRVCVCVSTATDLQVTKREWVTVNYRRRWWREDETRRQEALVTMTSVQRTQITRQIVDVWILQSSIHQTATLWSSYYNRCTPLDVVLLCSGHRPYRPHTHSSMSTTH